MYDAPGNTTGVSPSHFASPLRSLFPITRPTSTPASSRPHVIITQPSFPVVCDSIATPVDECNSSSWKIELLLEALASSGGNTRVSGDHNPIHVSTTFSSYANLTGTATHRMFSSGAVRSLVEASAAKNIARTRYVSSNFAGRVLPNHDIETEPHHTRMASCTLITNVGVSGETGEGVLVRGAEVIRPYLLIYYLPAKEVRGKV